jgi:carbonic anhydrase/acetyltransferase-like protein (isoleucine patch superfamily)
MMEGRLLLSTVPFVNKRHPFLHPLGFAAVTRPNTPVLPFQTPAKVATFVDPSAHINHGQHVIVGYKTYIGPFATLNAATGFIKIGGGSAILANASITSNPTGARNPTTTVLIGNNVSIGYSATVLGPSTIGSFSGTSKAVEIGPNALIDSATIEPGVIVGALARVGPGVTVPSGFRVLPGANVTTNAEASDPALGKVVPLTATDLANATQNILNYQALASGYVNVYQGNAATGVYGATGVTTGTAGGVNNGNLATI